MEVQKKRKDVIVNEKVYCWINKIRSLLHISLQTSLNIISFWVRTIV